MGSFFSVSWGRKKSPEKAGGEAVAGEFGVLLALEIEFIELLHEQQVGDLLNCGERIGDATGPEAVPEFVDEGFKRWIEL